MDIFKEFLKTNPNKVLGTIKETTDKYGNPDIAVVGDILELENIDVSDSILPDRNKDVSEIETLDLSIAKIDEGLRKAIEETAKQSKAEKPKAKRGTKNRKVFSIVREGDTTQELYKGDEAFKILNGNNFDAQYLSVWTWYNKSIGKPLNAYFNKFEIPATNAWFEANLINGNLCYDYETRAYMPSCIFYSGNIYDKITATESSTTNEIYTEEQKNKQLKNLKNILPTQLLLTGKEDERLVIDVLSKFADTFEIEDGGGETQSIREAFKDYIRDLDSAEFKYGIRSHEINNYYINGDRMPNYMDKVEKADLKRKASLECAFQMSKFLADIIPPKSRTSIEIYWNKEHNGFVDINYNKIPLYFEFSKLFKKANLEVRPAQREGVAFNSVNGTGIVAYDVGVGKTACAILNIANALQNGICKRPLFVVPKMTYEKWISEFRGIYNDDDELVGSGILPQYPIYDIFNLNPKVQSELFLSDGTFKGIPEGSISIVTYEGLSKIGFSQKMEGEFVDKLKQILNQGFKDESERAKVLDDAKLDKLIGVGVEGTVLNIDDAQFDYLCIDEAHNFNKIFSSVKGEAEDGGSRGSSQYKITGRQSARGIKSFFISNYIQSTNRYGNICLLTATPFTNNALEVYNILALTNFDRLTKYGVSSVISFFSNYIHQTYEKVITSSGEIEERAVIKGWINKISLQKILFSYMNYKSGEDANIQRPAKWTLPKLSENVDGVNIPLALEDQITTYLNPTTIQRESQKEISRWLLEQMRNQELAKKAPHLVADMKAKKNCISHYVYQNVAPSSIEPKDFINSSPKLKYTMDCIKSIIEWHKKDGSELSNQVIYINGAIRYLPIVKKYLLQELGYKENIYEYGKGKYFDEVEILTGGGGSDQDDDDDVKKLKRTDDEKEDIKTLFNEGKIKIIIGTSTIREGIDLQNRSTVLFNLWIDWNPTSYKQLEGRIWRFGNIYSNVRIVTPLIVGSSDAFTYQKLEEKTSRINDIFDRNDRTNILDVGEEDLEAVKWALIDDLKQIVIAKLKDESSLISKRIDIIDNDIQSIESIDYTMNELNDSMKTINEAIEKFWKWIPQIKTKLTDEEISQLDELGKMRLLNSNKAQIQDVAGDEWGWYDTRTIESAAWKIKTVKKNHEQLERLEKRMQDRFSASIYDGTEAILVSLNEERSDLLEQKEQINSDENIALETAKMEEDRVKFNSGIESFEETVGKFTKLNYLLGEMHKVQSVPVKSKAKAIEKMPEAIEDKKVVKIELPTETKLEEPIMNETQAIKDSIEGLELLIGLTKSKKEKQEIQDSIDGLKLLIDISSDENERDILDVGRERRSTEDFEFGTPVVYHKSDGSELSGEVVKRNGMKTISLYSNKNYSGSDPIVLKFNEINWNNVEKFSEATKRGGKPFKVTDDFVVYYS